MTSRSTIRIAVLVLTVGASFALYGCGAVDGVDLNGRVFDWMGVSESAQAKNKTEPKVAERAPLVVPPNMARLPEPGSNQGGNIETAAVQAQGQVAWPNDPDRRKALAAAEREKIHREYCTGERTWKERAMNPNADTSRSPYGPCNMFIGDMFQPSKTGTQN